MFNLFCKHNWKKVEHFVVPSVIDNVNEMGYSLSKEGGSYLFIRNYVTDYQCEKCGKLKRFTTSTSNIWN